MNERSSPSWDTLGEWWLTEIEGDPAYDAEVTPLLIALAAPTGRVLDVGCGEGRLMKEIAGAGAQPFGVDISRLLLRRAAVHGPVVQGSLPSLGWSADDSFDGAVVSLVLEHISDHLALFAELARVVRPGGSLSLVMNHPIYTAPQSAPIEEPDGEVLWRPGEYFGSGYTDEPAGRHHVRFHHRTVSSLLTDASSVGWDLRELSETGVTESQIERHPPLAQQRHIPRLLGIKWRRR
jgi:SAM-dependent methyltransferase